MQHQKLMLFSGFLGSGKTTTMVATAEYLKSQGIKVSLITNDLGENLVDTHYARYSNIPVSEIPNGCLCHDVPNFMNIARALSQKEQPDIIFAEPVGSCVDLVRSVYSEIGKNYAGEVELLPFTCVIDPKRYASVYMHPEDNTFNEEATYMYKKQLEDGDILLLNKCDSITQEEKDAVLESLHTNFPRADIVPISAIKSEHIEAWCSEFLKGQKPSMHKLDIDWDYILQGNQHMGWYNNILNLRSTDPSDFNKITEQILKEIQKGFELEHAEIAHLKIMCYTEKEFCKAALTGTNREIFFSNRFTGMDRDVLCNINIRAILPPDPIKRIIADAITKTADIYGLTVNENREQAFDSFTKAPAPSEGGIATA